MPSSPAFLRLTNEAKKPQEVPHSRANLAACGVSPYAFDAFGQDKSRGSLPKDRWNGIPSRDGDGHLEAAASPQEPIVNPSRGLRFRDILSDPTPPENPFSHLPADLHRQPTSIGYHRPLGLGEGVGQTMPRYSPSLYQDLMDQDPRSQQIRHFTHNPHGPYAEVNGHTYKSSNSQDAIFLPPRIDTGDNSSPLKKISSPVAGSHDLSDAMGVNVALDNFKASISEKITDYVKKVQTECAQEKKELANSHSADLEAAWEALREGEEEIKWLRKQMEELEIKVKMLELSKK